MKNKETVIGWVLIALLVIGFLFYQNQKMAEEAKNKKALPKTEKKSTAPASTATTETKSTDTSSAISNAISPPSQGILDSTALEGKYGVFAHAATGEEKLFVIENDLQKITLSTKGAQIKRVELKKYKTSDKVKQPLVLFTDKTNSLSYSFGIVENLSIETKDFYFEPVGESFSVSGDSSKSFTLRLMAGEGKYFEQKYTLKGNSYLLSHDVSLVGLDSVIPSNSTYIESKWQSKLIGLEQNLELERRYSAVYYKFSQSDVAHLNEDNEEDEFTFDSQAPLEWISFKQQFFSTTIFSKGEFFLPTLKSHYKKDDHSYVKQFNANYSLPYSSSKSVSYPMQIYMGPNHFNTLSAMDKDVESIIKLGPDLWVFSWISYITRFIIWVFSWFDSVHLNYGIIILLMTLLLKLALHPLTAKSIESAAKMKILAPELTALKEKYGDDQAKIGQEQMKIYQKAGVSPLGGCLPLLLQMPILMAMYYFFPASIELRQQPFLWATDLSSYDAIIEWKEPILTYTHISLFTILMTITSVGQAVMNNQMNAMANQQPGMKYIPYFMPVLLMFMFNSFPAALTYYYLLQNLLGMIHQWVIQKFFINDTKLRKQIEEHKKNPKPMSSWQKKIADMQKQAEQRSKQRKK